MKKLSLVFFLVFLLFSAVFARGHSLIHGYIKPSTGKFVMPYYKTSPNSVKFDNFSTKGNINPYTGKRGMR